MKEKIMNSMQRFAKAMFIPVLILPWIPGTHNYEGVSTPMDS